MLIGRQTLKQCCLTDKEGCWWTSSAEIICTCTWYPRHTAAAGPLIRKRERGFHRWLDSNLPWRAVSLLNLSFAMRLCSHRCVSSFIQREQPGNDHGGYAFREWHRLGWREAAASICEEVVWCGVPPLNSPGRSPNKPLLPVHSKASYKSTRLPYLPVSSKAVNNTYFLGPICQTVLLDVSQR